MVFDENYAISAVVILTSSGRLNLNVKTPVLALILLPAPYITCSHIYS